MLSKRTNILFDENLWQALIALAKKRNVSAGKLIREAVREKYIPDTKLSETKNLLEDIERIRPRFKGKIDYKELINYGRK